MNEQDRQYTYKCNIQARSRNHCCRGRAISNTCSECVSVALRIQRAERTIRIVICGLFGCTVFFHIILLARFSGGVGGGVIEHTRLLISP